MMNYQYNHDYFPPAPFVDVVFVTPAEPLYTSVLPAFVDSGADGTIVPIHYLEEIQALPTVEMSIRSQWGEGRSVMLYLVDVRIGNLTLPGIEVVGDEISQEIVLGRDILNRLRILLNGPKDRVEVSE
jgi:predicted aspartyl protease